MSFTTQALVGQLRDSTKYPPDFKILCHGEEFKVHKFPLDLRSGYYARMFSSKGSFIENKEGISRLEDEQYEPKIVKAIIDVIYKDDYDYEQDLHYHVKISRLADYFQIKQVDDIVVAKIMFENRGRKSPLKFSRGSHNVRTDKDFLTSLRILFNNATNGKSFQARGMIADLLMANCRELGGKPGMSELLDTKGLATEFFSAQRRGSETEPTCFSCGGQKRMY